MIEGSSVFKGHGVPHQQFPDLYAQWWQDLIAVSLFGELVHSYIWRWDGSTPMVEAKRLSQAGLIVLEDSPQGPVVTRTWRGSFAIQEWQKAVKQNEETR